MAENLKKTLTVNGTEYDINAVYSDTAGYSAKAGESDTSKSSESATRADTADTSTIAEKLANYLSVKESGTFAFNFDGSKVETIDYVSAEKGGTYKSPIYIDTTAEITDKKAVLTNEQVNNKIEKLTGAPLYSWNKDDNELLLALVDDNDQTRKLTTLFGTTTSFEIIKRMLLNGRSGFGPGINFNISRDETTKIPIYCRVLASNNITTDLIVIPYNYVFEDTQQTHKTYVLPVTGLYPGAYKNETTITGVILPESITEISLEAFSGCSSLKRLTLPPSITNIAGKAFYNCAALEKLVIPSSVQR